MHLQGIFMVPRPTRSAVRQSRTSCSPTRSSWQPAGTRQQQHHAQHDGGPERRRHPAEAEPRRSRCADRQGRRARSAAPIIPALLPSSAARTSSVGAVVPAGEVGLEVRPDRVQQQVAGLGDPAADDDARPGRGPRSGRRSPRPATGRATASCSRATGSPSRAASVICGAADAVDGSPRPGRAGPGRPSEPCAACSLASRTSAVPLAYCSQQPRLPQPQQPAVRHDAACARSRRRRRSGRGTARRRGRCRRRCRCRR